MTDDEIKRARRVRDLLANDDFRQAMADVEAERHAEWACLAWDEAAKAEMLRAEHRAQQRIVQKLQSWVDELTLRRIQ